MQSKNKVHIKCLQTSSKVYFVGTGQFDRSYPEPNEYLTAATGKERSKLAAKDKRLYSTYGITLDDWNLMFFNQKGVCWICQTLPKSKILCIDHRHVPKYKKLSSEEKAKEVRGLLCFSCNTGLHGLEKRKNARFLFEQVNLYFKKFKIKGDL